MLMDMVELAFLLVPEATCESTEADVANAISTTPDYWFHRNHQGFAQKVVWPTRFSPDLTFLSPLQTANLHPQRSMLLPMLVSHCLYALRRNRDAGHK